MAQTAKNWFVAQLRPNALGRAQDNLQRQGFASFHPTRLEGRVARGQRVNRPRPLFPGYLFVQFDPQTPGWQAINATRGISRLILNHTQNPTPLPAAFMAGLMARCDAYGLIDVAPDLQQGDRVRILSGPFADMVASIDSLAPDDRLRLLVDLMGQRVKTSVQAVRVEKV